MSALLSPDNFIDWSCVTVIASNLQASTLLLETFPHICQDDWLQQAHIGACIIADSLRILKPPFNF